MTAALRNTQYSVSRDRRPVVSCVKNLPPDPKLASWPYVYESDVPKWLRRYDLHELSIALSGYEWNSGTSIREKVRILRSLAARHLYQVEHGYAATYDTGNKLRGERHPSCKLSFKNIEKIRSLASSGSSHKELAAMFNISHHYVSKIVRGIVREHQ